ncbi:glucosamine-6-phosphate deaminase [Lacticaseibacillus daqingensis]|uniref:glucosamine-6-phosphate deaminase n=1 Tax=Lacticaseibacillus daqingensis TaxID=2486014 RepID=UPI000F7AC73A|nr:glucosamine-6-phosphate deaminase [Lacticaseibacillus daqingensis]
MNDQVFRSTAQLVTQVVDEIVAVVQQKPDATLCIAAGDTPIPVMRELARRALAGEVDLSRVRFLGLDEWVGLTPQTKGTCIETLTTHLFAPAQISPRRIHFFRTDAEDLPEEIARINDFVALHGIDYILLGIGMNGHIGFNEPGVEVTAQAHQVALAETTKRVMRKYFDQDFPLESGITLGFAQILAAKQVVLMATGAQKAAIVRKTVRTAPTNQLPATLLKLAAHPCRFYVDQAAGQELE